jgi:uncharacterized membrane protein YjfL (UPF0719 family)
MVKSRTVIMSVLIIMPMICMRAFTQTQTRVRQFPEMTIVRRGNFVIGATTDGYLCYGTRVPLAASCHKAVPEVIYAGE